LTLKFGTDGIRGVANLELTPELSLALGRAAALVFGTDVPFIVGRDTRLSGPTLQASLSAGLASEGADVVDAGELPTPAIAHLSATRNAPAAMISASHNPFADNGIKFFSVGGRKLSDGTEQQFEQTLDRVRTESGMNPRPVGAGIGRLSVDHDAKVTYEEHLLSILGNGALNDLRVVLDCAHGAASVPAPEVFRELGATVTVLNDQPNGENINENCGSTHPAGMQEAVVRMGADAGLAFDGDADRVLAADHTGALIDGDQIMGMLALQARASGKLKDDTLVVTVMSNLGLRLSMEQNGIRLHETKVGDRYVLEALAEHGWSLGGEQSGHVIFPEFAWTGDGLLTGLKVLSLMESSGRSLADLAAEAMTRLPQVLRNIRTTSQVDLSTATDVWDVVREVESELGELGRVLLRPSGTEPLIRVMVEAPSLEQANGACERICNAVVYAYGIV